jgi:predicted RND superfamily exporter protein
VQWIQAHAGRLVLVSLAVLGASALLASRLALRTDLSELLPPDTPSVVGLHHVLSQVEGLSHLTVVIESPDPAANRRFADRLADRLQSDVPGLRGRVEARRPGATFLREHALLYTPLGELEELRALADAATIEMIRERNPFFIDLEDAPRGRARDALSRRLRDLDRRASRSDHLQGEEGRLVAVLVRPSGASTDVSSSRALVDAVLRQVAALGPLRFHPAMTVGMAGPVKLTLDEYQAFTRDLVSTAGLTVLLVSLVIALYFRRIGPLWMLFGTLLLGIALALALAEVWIGYLNGPVAFLAALIVGVGINYGIVLLARYHEARASGSEVGPALEVALQGALRPTLVAAVTTAVSFLGLVISQTRSFRHFGVIGGAGVLFCWLLSFSLLPALVVLSERWRVGLRPSRGLAPLAYPAWLARLPITHAGPLRLVGLLSLPLILVGLYRYLPDALETDLSRLRNRVRSHSASAALERRVSPILTGSQRSSTPVVLVTGSVDESRLLCRRLGEERARLGAAARTGACRDVDSLLPRDQARKLAVAARLRRLAAKAPDAVPPRVQALLHPAPVTLGQLPDELVRPFRDRSGSVGRVVYLDAPGSLWRGDNLFRFASAVREIRVGPGLEGSGEPVIYADLLNQIRRDAPVATLLALAGVLVCLAVAYRGAGAVVACGLSLVLGVAWMLALTALWGVKLNFFNFVAVPLTFGVGIDYAVNVEQRYRQGPPGAAGLKQALVRSGSTVILMSLTTQIAYFTLLVADNRALASFGALAGLGEITCLLAALFFLPAWVMRGQGQERPVAEGLPSGPRVPAPF